MIPRMRGGFNFDGAPNRIWLQGPQPLVVTGPPTVCHRRCPNRRNMIWNGASFRPRSSLRARRVHAYFGVSAVERVIKYSDYIAVLFLHSTVQIIRTVILIFKVGKNVLF